LSDRTDDGGPPPPETSAEAPTEGRDDNSPQGATAQADESPTAPQPGEASSATAAPHDAPSDDDSSSVWERVRRSSLPRPVRRFAMRRVIVADAREMQRSLSRGDPAENAATRLPPGEQIRLPLIWLAEIFTPTTIDGLIDGMRKLASRPTGSWPARTDDLAEWIRSSRREGLFTFHNVPYIRPRGFISFDPMVEDELPTAISYVHPRLYTLTPTATVLTATFGLMDEHAGGLGEILNRDFSTRVDVSDRSSTVLSVGSQKDKATDDWRATLREEAARWLAERFPGSMHKLVPGQLPAIEFLLTGLYRPWEPVEDLSDNPAWTSVIDINGGFGYWQADSTPGLRLSERHVRAQKSHQHVLIFATAEQDLLDGKPSDPQRLAQAIAGLDWSMSGLIARWSLTAFLRELEEQVPSIQDAADRASRKRSGRTLTELQQQLLRAGLDSRIVVNDMVRFTQNRLWGYDLPDFRRVTPPRVAFLREPTVTLTQWLRQGQAEDGRRVIRMENDLREVLSTNAELTAASINLRVQWTAVWIAAIAAFAAVVAVIIALWPHQNSPATQTPTEHATTHSTSSPSVRSSSP
jgi:hypothetical protein